MPNRFWTLVWIAAAAVGVFFAISTPDAAPEESWRFALAALMAIVTLVGILDTPLRDAVAQPLRTLRRSPALYWLVILVAFCVTLGAWLVAYQPTNGRPLVGAEFTYLCFVLWFMLYLLVFDLNRARGRTLAAGLGKSRATGVLITLTTLVVLFFLGEGYLRVFYITTDGYGFTAMNYHWYKNFLWNSLNSLGYRDYEPKADPDGTLTQIAIVGDSFAVGHGINDINQTFGQLLEQQLGDGADVLMVAASGRDSDVMVSTLDQYPIQPDIVVLSYYLNDIDYLMAGTELDPDANFDFIQDQNLHWFVLNFFLPNYIYYNLIQFTSPVRSGNFINDLIQAHLNDDLWPRHANNLNAMVEWARQHDAQLIVLLWPHLAAIAESKPATDRVRLFFTDAGVPVIDMGERLLGRSTSELIVNRFDTHPGPLAHRIAAEALYEVISGEVLAAASDGGSGGS
ncbi:MAG: hypothetical protein IPK19_33285 [Chloroflexi bacterium]|nr:hypothetical protein [Chloroflexota bacterium]